MAGGSELRSRNAAQPRFATPLRPELPGLHEGRGAPPHFVVEQALEDSLQGRDTALELTLELIRARARP